MRKLILSGDGWFELKHTLELLVIVANNAANEHENMAAHAQAAELSERYANLAKRDREREENYKRLMARVESAERLPETKAERLGYEPEEETRERQERLLEELRYREAMRRVAKTCCVWLGGAAFVLAVIAGYAEMADACVATGAIALGLTTYGIL